MHRCSQWPPAQQLPRRRRRRHLVSLDTSTSSALFQPPFIPAAHQPRLHVSAAPTALLSLCFCLSISHFLLLSTSTMFGAGAPKCPRCTKSVYEAEEVRAAGQRFHVQCFTCSDCHTRLNSTTLCDANSDIFCSACYAKRFGPKVTTSHTHHTPHTVTTCTRCWDTGNGSRSCADSSPPHWLCAQGFGIGGLSVHTGQSVADAGACGACGAKDQTGKFCGACGKATGRSRYGAAVPRSSRFLSRAPCVHPRPTLRGRQGQRRGWGRSGGAGRRRPVRQVS